MREEQLETYFELQQQIKECIDSRAKAYCSIMATEKTGLADNYYREFHYEYKIDPDYEGCIAISFDYEEGAMGYYNTYTGNLILPHNMITDTDEEWEQFLIELPKTIAENNEKFDAKEKAKKLAEETKKARAQAAREIQTLKALSEKYKGVEV